VPLAVDDHRVHDHAVVVDGHDPHDLHRAELGVDLDDRDVGPEGERLR